MTTVDEARDHIAHMDDLSERELVEMIVPFITARNSKQASEKVMEAFSKRLKAWLDSHPGDELVDGETGNRAYLQNRNGKKTYDLVAIYDQDPILFDRLRATGCLMVNADAVKAQGANVAGVEKYASFAASTTALIVEQIKNG